ncbi:PKD domain-containing protein [Hymenobacter weizhouensis]|uniref:PKD domain-containing protein n=1 Tax=Hymenobacter sp. YIM 151500-1 TaxID=2987689 RepID=UPI00222772D9|nr:PKD domain-containing protein [Hymenobacter sp. YIM 151500-1]UYZ61460.1 PKD domain-containing protein [Hymenobacter sp. YIM 151500-1]
MHKMYPVALALLSLGSALAQKGPPVQLPQQKKAAVSLVPNQSFRPDPSSRIDGDLQQLYQRSRTVQSAKQLRTEFAGLTVAEPGQPAGTARRGTATSPVTSVLVRITAKDVNALLPQLTARGFRVVSSHPKLHFVEGYLPVAELAPGKAGISSLDQRGLLGVLGVLKPQARVGRVQNQADFVLEANRVRGARPTGFNGQGVRIGVLSDSYDALGGAATDAASGDVPANVQIIEDIPGGSDEGRAMVQLIHDIAPGAAQAFATAFETEGRFADNIRALADPARGNCKIIVDDVGYFAEPFFQDGVIAQAVEEVATQRGVAYYSAAGNSANLSSEYISPAFQATTGGSADLNFAATGGQADTRQRFRVRKGTRLIVSLQWSDPFYTASGVRTDLDMYLLRANGDTVARRATNNLANQTPVEILGFANFSPADTITLYDLVIRRRAGSADPARLKYVLFEGDAPREYFTGSGTIIGHAAAANAQAVAAVPSYNRTTVESFSSFGSPTILFNPDGTPLAAPSTRPKPDMTSVDGVSTTFFNGPALPDPQDGFLFFGTSAAAPNAAAVAALLWQAEPNLTQAQLNTRLKNTARDINVAGFDIRTGAGLINAYTAIFGPIVPVAGPVLETLDDQLGRTWQVSDLGAGRSLVRNNFGPASAPAQLIQDSFFPQFYSSQSLQGLSIATLRLNLSATPTGGWTLTFRHKRFDGEDDQQMPATFTGNSGTDGVALSVNGTNWFRLADLTGTSSTTSYQTQTIDLTAFAQANNLTLGSDVRIRFQRFGTTRVDAANPAVRGGRAFDDITVTGPVAAQTPVPLFSLSASPAEPICPGSTVQFQNSSLFAAPTAFSWSFPGGSPAASTDASPSVTYAAAGSYDVTLTITTAGGTFTRTVPGAVVVSSEVPQAAFAVRPNTPLCPGTPVRFVNQSLLTRCATTYAWTFAGGSPATSTDANPTVTFAAPGTYTVTLTATNANGSTTRTRSVIIQAGAALPYAETFQSGLPATWAVLNPDNSFTWAAVTGVLRKDGTRGPVLIMPFGPYDDAGQRDSLQSPLLDLRSQSRATLRFDMAYAPILSPQQGNDSLTVDVFAACTNTRLGRAYLKSALTGLPTTAAQDSFFIPRSVGQWRQEEADLTSFANQQVYLRFIAYNQFGNNLFLTNVRVDNGGLTTGTRAQVDSPALLAYPNPVGAGYSLTLQLPQLPGTASIRLVDGVGRVTWQAQWNLSATTPLRREVSVPLSAGLYTVLCQTADGQLFSRRVVVQH